MTKLENPQSILDIGTGTGIWAIESLFHHHHSIFGTELTLHIQWATCSPQQK